MSHAPRTWSIALLALAACGGGGAGGGGGTRPDVLMLLVDTLRADRLGCYGYPRETSPNLDALARRGTVFLRASAQAPWTIPSVSSILTGAYPTAHQEHPDPALPTLPEVFQRAGYRTLGVCANFVIVPELGFGRGFDEYVPRSTLDARGRRRKRPEGEFSNVLEWLEEPLVRALRPDASGRRPPLFLYVHPVDPHATYLPHENLAQVLPEGGDPEIQPAGWLEQTLAAVGPPAPPEDPGWSEALALMRRERTYYDREVRSMDATFQRLLARLAELGVGENLIVAVLSDHGEELWEHLTPLPAETLRALPPREVFFQAHGYLLSEQVLRTPLILAGPGVPAGVRVTAPAENVDLFPTLLELCDIGIDFDVHGRSLVPLARGAGEAREDTFAWVQQCMMVREESSGLKLLLPTELGLKKGLAPQLFDLGADPFERVDLFAQRPADAARLTQKLQDYLARHPTSEQVLSGKSAEDLRELLRENGYAGDMLGGEGK